MLPYLGKESITVVFLSNTETFLSLSLNSSFSCKLPKVEFMGSFKLFYLEFETDANSLKFELIPKSAGNFLPKNLINFSIGLLKLGDSAVLFLSRTLNAL